MYTHPISVFWAITTFMQLELFDVPSPCIGVCQSDVKGYCLGCLRNRQERQSWISLTVNDKQKVIKRCNQRKKRRDAPAKAIKVTISQPQITQGSLLDESQSFELNPPTLESQVITTSNQVKVAAADDLDFSDFEL
jgi:predicted Fe-S protein YdhL (DUF1289 family)